MVKSLQTLLQLFSIVVFGCISSKGWYQDGPDGGKQCLYDDDSNACGYGVAIGVLAFIGLLIFLALDAIFETHISSVQHRRYVVMADVAFSGWC